MSLNIESITIHSCVSGVHCRQQYFVVRPQDVEVAEGSEAVIVCQVGNREGRVQWTKDGLTLGRNKDHFQGEIMWRIVFLGARLPRFHSG